VLHNRVGGQKLFKLFGRYSLIFILFFFTLNAKTFENFKRSSADTYSKYKDKNDIKFSKSLKQQFKAYLISKDVKSYEESKPLSLSIAIANRIKPAGPIIHVNVDENKQKIDMMIEVDKNAEKDISFSYFGSTLKLNIPPKIKSAKYYPQNQKGINNFFDMVASSAYENLLLDIKNICKRMKLNDWGLYLLIKKISKNTFSNTDDAKLLTWFLFSKMGYAVKIGLVSKHIVLMHYSKNIIYSKSSYKFDDKNFYVLDNSNIRYRRVYSYKYNYDGSDKSFDLSLDTLPNLKHEIEEKKLKFKSQGTIHTIKYSYNKNLIDFMATYPQANYETFFNAPMQEKTYTDIANGLKKFIDSRQASSAINFILNFVQNAFIYEVDKKQFGHEKVMFAQEVLYYDKSDCDDRSVLFSYLVKKLFGFSVVGVKYKDHMATALYIPMTGDSVNVNSKKYIVADPSFIDASIGQSIPKYKSIKPQSFIVINKS